MTGYANFKFKQDGNNVKVKMQTQMSKEMTTALITDLLLSIQNEFGSGEVNEIMQSVMINLIILGKEPPEDINEDDEL